MKIYSMEAQLRDGEHNPSLILHHAVKYTYPWKLILINEMKNLSTYEQE